jgi:hypothetical protein
VKLKVVAGNQSALNNSTQCLGVSTPRAVTHARA